MAKIAFLYQHSTLGVFPASGNETDSTLLDKRVGVVKFVNSWYIKAGTFIIFK